MSKFQATAPVVLLAPSKSLPMQKRYYYIVIGFLLSYTYMSKSQIYNRQMTKTAVYDIVKDVEKIHRYMKSPRQSTVITLFSKS